MPCSKQIEQQPPTSSHTPQHVQRAPQKLSAAGPRCTCACCIPGACACLVLGMGKQETPCCCNPLLFWEERVGGGKAWPGLPVTLQNSFKAQQCKRELGKCVAVWLQETVVPPKPPARSDNPSPSLRPARCHLPAWDGSGPHSCQQCCSSS